MENKNNIPCKNCICYPTCKTIISKPTPRHDASNIWKLFKQCKLVYNYARCDDRTFHMCYIKTIYETFDCIHIWKNE